MRLICLSIQTADTPRRRFTRTLRDQTKSRHVFYANILSDDSARQIISRRCRFPLRMSFIHYIFITRGVTSNNSNRSASMKNVRELQRIFSFTSFLGAFMRESVKNSILLPLLLTPPATFPGLLYLSRAPETPRKKALRVANLVSA